MNQKITIEMMEAIKPTGRWKWFYYDSIQSFQAALRHAYKIRKEHLRKDKGVYEITTTAAFGKIGIRVVPCEDKR